MKWSRPVLALMISMGYAQAAPAIVLHVLKNGHVRFAEGPELNTDQFKVELQKRTAEKSLPLMTLGLEQKPDFAATAAVLAAIQDSGVKIGFVVGPHR